MDGVPFDTIELHDDEICLHNLALIAPGSVDIILSIMEEVLALIECEPAANLRHILLVPDVDVVTSVQLAVTRLCGAFEADWDGVRQVTRTAAFPVEREGELSTYLIVNEALPKSLTPATAHNLDTIGNVLESFLHAFIHGRIRELCRADTRATELAFAAAGPIEWSGEEVKRPCDERADVPVSVGRGSLRELTMKTLEAYLVYRTKIAIMSKNDLVQLEPDGDFVHAIPRHPADIAARLEQSAAELRTAIDGAASHRVTASEGWGQIRRMLFRGVLDPLARHTAYVAHSPSNVALAEEPRQSRFYQVTVAPFWTRLYPELELAYTTRCETAASIETSEELIKMFLTQLGITHSGERDGESHITFDRRWSSAN